ncbi:nucleolar protein 12-like [Sinocyclocheilus anshuiensis]|uniref:Nucleolar protein 12 n=1 Tax=Sinocyclocheilus anshuiensis TaxID=1608454 RepID=A0A671NKE8_9TELE|nr:PREDICTED: nucleolar protein 12-like [Sinocyclocheilus anshuiensis]
MAKNDKWKQKSKFNSGVKHKKNQRKCVLMFDDKDRQEFLTGFHKRKLERRRAALEEMKSKLKEEQKRVREERRREYFKMLQERRQALDEADELVDAITATKESVQYDHPNHTVTVTTISDLDLSADRLLEPDQRNEEREEEKDGEKIQALPKTAGNPLMSEKIQRLTASLNSLSKQKKKRRKRKPKEEMRRRNHQSDWKSSPFTHNKKLRKAKSTKAQRRKWTGQNERNQD